MAVFNTQGTSQQFDVWNDFLNNGNKQQDATPRAYGQYAQSGSKASEGEKAMTNFVSNGAGAYQSPQYGVAAQQGMQNSRAGVSSGFGQVYGNTARSGQGATSFVGNQGAASGARTAGMYGDAYLPSTLGTSQADLTRYYDKAYDSGARRINQDMATRGLLGSSAAADQATELSAKLGAEESNRLADYELQRKVAEGQYGVNRSNSMNQWAGTMNSNDLDYTKLGVGTQSDYAKLLADIYGKGADVELGYQKGIGDLAGTNDKAALDSAQERRYLMDQYLDSAGAQDKMYRGRQQEMLDAAKLADAAKYGALESKMGAASKAQQGEADLATWDFESNFKLGSAVAAQTQAAYQQLSENDKNLMDAYFGIGAMSDSQKAEFYAKAGLNDTAAFNNTLALIQKGGLALANKK